MPTVFVSDAILQDRLLRAPRPGQDRGQREDRWGWKALSALYASSLAACFYRTAYVARPEIYQSDIARTVFGVAPGDWHLAIKPMEHLRPFHGIPNVFVCDWQYPELSGSPIGDSPFFNQVRLLRNADAVVCCTDFTTATLHEAGLDRAITLPPVIQSQPVAPPQHTGCCFLSVVDIDHMGRQLGATIEGFALAARERSDLRLAIHLAGAGAQVLAGLRQRVAKALPDRPETIAIMEAGIDSPTAAGGASADFFLCADAAAGLHLPVAKAMLAGLPLVTTISAGIESFLPKEAAVRVATRRGVLPREDEPIARFLPLTTSPASAEAICSAILEAAALDHNARTRMAAVARQAAERRFGQAAFNSGMEQLRALVPLEPA